MSGAILRHGNYRTSTGPGFAVAYGPQQIATFDGTNNHSGAIIWYRMGAWVGKYSGTPIGRFAALLQSSDTSRPGAVAGYTDEFTPTAVYVDGAGGQQVFANLTTPIVDSTGYDYTFAATARNGDLSVAMYHADNPAVSGRNRNLWRKNISGNIPVDAVSSTVTYEGQLNIWMEGERNVAPNQPGAATISGGTGNRRPTFTNSFSDANETLNNGVAYDRLAQHRHEIWWDGVRRWTQTFTATTAEQTGKYSQRQIGIDVPYDTTVEHRVYHIDRMGAESAYRSATFVVQSGATVDRPTSPSGRVTNLANPGNIVAVYRNNASLSANAVRLGVFTSGGTLIKQSAIITTTVAPNGTINQAWSNLAYTLAPGESVNVAVQARATNGVWSNWSAFSAVQANAAPSIPVITAPTNGLVTGALPELRATVTDDQAASQVTVYFEVLSNADAVLGTYTGTLVSGNEYRVLASAYASVASGYATYKVRAYAYDGYLYSGAATTAATASRSGARSFTYAAVPAVTITFPSGSTVTTAQPPITWTNTSDQAQYRVRLTNDSGATVYDTGTITSVAKRHTISPGYWLAGESWNNGETFNVIVSVTDSSPLTGDSSAKALTLQYAPATSLVLTVSEYALPGVAGTHALDISVGNTEYTQAEFFHYRFERYEITGPGGVVIDGSYTLLADITDASETRLLDFDVTSRQWYRVYASQAVKLGADIIYSTPVSTDIMVSWHGTLLHMPFDPESTYVWLQYGAIGSNYEVNRTESYRDQPVMPMYGRAPIGYVGRARELTPSGDYSFIPKEGETATESTDALWRLMDYQNPEYSPDGRPHIICWREGRGGRRGRLYVHLNEIGESATRLRTHTVSLDFSERAHRVGTPTGGGQ